MVEPRNRDVSSKWTYLCYPCAAVCTGETSLQSHLSGKKHKNKLDQKKIWPVSIFEEHPHILKEKNIIQSGAAEEIDEKVGKEVTFPDVDADELDLKFNKYKEVECHIQETLDAVKTPLLGLEYLIEHSPDRPRCEPSYTCTLCSKQGHPRTIVNHLTSFWHRYRYVARHFPKAEMKLAPHRCHVKLREGVLTIVNRLAQLIEHKYGRLKPTNIDKEEYEKNKESIFQWIFKGYHFSEQLGLTFDEFVDDELINSLSKPDSSFSKDVRNPSPPVVPAPTKPAPSSTRLGARQTKRHASTESLSDISDNDLQRPSDGGGDSDRPDDRDKYESSRRPSHEKFPDKYSSTYRSRYASRNNQDKEKFRVSSNHDYKMKLVVETKQASIEAARKILAYHKKNPEKHPLYPEEWKKFWNKRYKEIQAEGKDPSKHDFKPEWISYWTVRMKELHDDELRLNINELYRRMGVAPSDLHDYEKQSSDGRRSPKRRLSNPRSSRSPLRRRSPESRRRSPVSRRSPDTRRRSPDLRRRSPDSRRRSPDLRRHSPEFRRRSPDLRRRSPIPRRNSPDYHRHPTSPRRMSPYSRRRSQEGRRSIDYHRDKRSPVPRRRSPEHRRSPMRSRSPHKKSPASRHSVESVRRSDARGSQRNLSPQPAPSMQTVLISDDELCPDDGLSPWNSDDDIESVDPMKDTRSRGDCVASRNPRSHHGRHGSRGPPRSHGSRAQQSSQSTTHAGAQDFGPTDNVVATLRLLVALEDYLGSLGPKVVDLLTEALKMEKEKGNSSEELLEREGVVALLETAKEKLKGAVQAGLVTGSAASAVRAAVVRLAATLYEADKRRRRKQTQSKNSEAAEPVAVAGVGAVERAEIASQMAAALVAEGRTDVSPEELAQLVEAVVGMAEAKKREVEAMRQARDKGSSMGPAKSALNRSSASALQMLQSAYDDKNALAQREDAADAMDGLSDSDLETLLKNFNELSAEEQHSLIAYLKKLEVREPQRVEKLRQFVGAAAASASRLAPECPDTKPVAIESDDDDYTVEEVFKSAAQKVKENQIQQEMEIVKKSLEETNTSNEPDATATVNPMQITIQSSAADLLALVQASIQSSTPTSANQTSEVVSSTSQLRSFGDIPELPTIESRNSPINVRSNSVMSEPPVFQSNQSPSKYHGLTLDSPQQLIQFGVNLGNSIENYSHNSNQNVLGQNRQFPMLDIPQSLMASGKQLYMGDGTQFPTTDNMQHVIQDSRQPLINDSKQSLINDNRQPFTEYRQSLLGDGRQSLLSDNKPNLMADTKPFATGNVGSAFRTDIRQTFMTDSRQPLLSDNRQFLMTDNKQSLMTDNRQFLMTDNRQSLMTDNRLSMMTDNLQSSTTNNKQPLLTDNRQPFVPDNRETMQSGYDVYNRGNSYNRGGRGNSRNGIMPDNFSFRPKLNPQNFNSNVTANVNFRGRGGRRGFSGARGRGRGRV
ncbi:uncharacterized protein CG7065-like isoform X2 [Battus philenor]